MTPKLKALPSNILASHPAYSKILLQYNEILKNDGKVNNKKFYEEYILPEIPRYQMQSWYYFLKRFKAKHGLIAVEMTTEKSGRAISMNNENGKVLVETMLSNQEATQKGIQRALNIGNARLVELMDNPQLMTAKDAVDLLFKAMKAQDSRIHAVGKVREDNREQERFDRAFGAAAYGD